MRAAAIEGIGHEVAEIARAAHGDVDRARPLRVLGGDAIRPRLANAIVQPDKGGVDLVGGRVVRVELGEGRDVFGQRRRRG